MLAIRDRGFHIFHSYPPHLLHKQPRSHKRKELFCKGICCLSQRKGICSLRYTLIFPKYPYVILSWLCRPLWCCVVRCKYCIFRIFIHADVVQTGRCTVFDITSFCPMRMNVCLFTIYFELWNKPISEFFFYSGRQKVPGIRLLQAPHFQTYAYF